MFFEFYGVRMCEFLKLLFETAGMDQWLRSHAALAEFGPQNPHWVTFNGLTSSTREFNALFWSPVIIMCVGVHVQVYPHPYPHPVHMHNKNKDKIIFKLLFELQP